MTGALLYWLVQRAFFTFLLFLAASLLLQAVPLLGDPPSAPRAGVEGIVPLLSAAEIDAERIEALLQRQPGAVVVEISAGPDPGGLRGLAKEALHPGDSVVRLDRSRPQQGVGGGAPRVDGRHRHARTLEDTISRFPETGEDEVVKIYPWVTVWYEEAFDAQLSRIEQLIQKTGVEWAGVFLHNI